MLKSIGIDTDAAQMEDAMLANGLVSPAWGLLDGSGAGLARFLHEQTGNALVVENWSGVSWEHVQQRAGTGPLGLGGARWNHWAAVRRANADGTLEIMNPAPGWMGVGDTLTEADFARLGPFAAVYIVVPDAPAEEDDMSLLVRIAELEQQLAEARSYQGAVAAHIITPTVAECDALLARPDVQRLTSAAGRALRAQVATTAERLRPHVIEEPS